MINWITIDGHYVRVAWRTKTTQKQMKYYLVDGQLDELRSFIRTGNLDHLGNILNYPNRFEEFHYLIVAEILWALARGKRIKKKASFPPSRKREGIQGGTIMKKKIHQLSLFLFSYISFYMLYHNTGSIFLPCSSPLTNLVDNY